jgi:hypothetical protein
MELLIPLRRAHPHRQERKLTVWVLAEGGHGPDFRRARGLEPEDRELVRAALLVHVREQPVEGVRASHALVGPQAGDWAVDGPSRSAAGAPG